MTSIMGMPRYAFVTLEPGQSRRDVDLNLSAFGEVRIFSKISEVSSLVTDLVRNLEAHLDDSTLISPIIETLPSARPVLRIDRISPPPQQHQLLGDLIGRYKRPVSTNRKAMGTIKKPFIMSSSSSHHHDQSSSSSSLFHLTASPSPPASTPMELLEQSVTATEESQRSLLQEEENDDYIIVKDEPIEVSGTTSSFDECADLREEHVMDGGPCSSLLSLAAEMNSQLAADMEDLEDEDGQLEVPYAPDFSECRAGMERRREARREREDMTSAKCEVCKRWVTVTENNSRLIAHVFMHTQKKRYICPQAGCVYSNDNLTKTKQHINGAHVEDRKTLDPIDTSLDKAKVSRSWKEDRARWAPLCFPAHFDASGDEIFMKVNGSDVSYKNRFMTYASP